MTSERGLTHAEAMDAIFERFFRRSPEAGYSFAEFKADAMTILEATAAAEQRLRERIEALRHPFDTLTEYGRGWNEALDRGLLDSDTPAPASPRQGEPQAALASDPASPSEPAIPLHQGAASPRQGEPVDVERLARKLHDDLCDCPGDDSPGCHLRRWAATHRATSLLVDAEFNRGHAALSEPAEAGEPVTQEEN